MRIVLGLPIAALVTFGLFLAMRSFMGGGNYQAPEEVAGIEIPDFIVKQKTVDPRHDPPVRPEPVDKVAPPGPVDPHDLSLDGADGELDTSFQVLHEPEIGSEFVVDGQAIPTLRVAPQYPSCGRNREGWVLLAFDVSETGQPENIRVVDADPADGCFEKAAVAALKRWKYKARMVDGRPAVRPGQQVMISFEVE